MDKTSSKYEDSFIEQIIQEVSMKYSFLYKNPKEDIEEIRKLNSKKKILGKLLRLFGLYDMYKNKKIKITYGINYDCRNNKGGYTVYDKKNKDFRINFYNVGGYFNPHNDYLEDGYKKNLFILIFFHELTHVRYIVDDFKYKDFEVAVDILPLFFKIFKEQEYIRHTYNSYVGYIDNINYISIKKQVKEKSQIIYL